LMFVGQMVWADSTQTAAGQSIIAQAGRRVDAAKSETTRFPSTNVPLRERYTATSNSSLEFL
jgi:hypothetical protein